MLGTTLWQHAKMTTPLKSPEGLKDSKCKKGQLGSWPPVLFVPPTDLAMTKESSDDLNVKLDDGTVFYIIIFS
jgi:hypothetical protein